MIRQGFIMLLTAAALLLPAAAQHVIRVEMAGVPAHHELTWNTRVNYNYHVEASADLASWVDTDTNEPGTGGDVTLGFSLPAAGPRLFYRIKEFVDPLNGGFLSRPFNREEVDLTDGVCFAFRLDALPAIPARILIHQRPLQAGAPWQLIGNITDIATLGSVVTVRGSVVWLPETPGEYEVQAVARTAGNVPLGTAVRRVSVGGNQAPVITINGPAEGFDPPFVFTGPSQFSVTVQDGDGDPVTRVEFFDNGLYVGTDTQPPFGDHIEHEYVGGTPIFWRGIHAITAVAYDRRGAAGSTAQPYLFEVINGPAAPTVSVTSVQPGLVVQQGQPLIINVAAADDDGNLASVEGYNLRNRLDWQATDSVAPLSQLTFDTSPWPPGMHRIVVFAVDEGNGGPGITSHSVVITVQVRDALGGNFAEVLADEICDGVTVTPVENGQFGHPVYFGSLAAAGLFDQGIDAGLEINQGILMSTGLAASWDAGNLSGSTTSQLFESGDKWLTDWLGGGDPNYTTYDASVLEFELFSAHRQLEFEIQFGSEEYDEYVGQYNDGFLVGLNGAVVSLTPDCGDVISVNAIHDTEVSASRPHLFRETPRYDPNDPVNANLRRVEYDGTTARLRSHVLLKPAALHRIRFAIADAIDWRLDAAIFVKKASLRSINPQP